MARKTGRIAGAGGGCTEARQRGWMVPAYTLPPDADDVKIMRVLVGRH